MADPAFSNWHHGQDHFRRVHACPACDLLLARVDNTKRHRARCPRCKTLLYHHHPYAPQWLIACALAGLLLFWPAMAKPLVGLNALGQQSQVSVLESVAAVWRDGFHDVAIWVGLFAVVIPLLRLLMLLFIGVAAQVQADSALARRALRSSQKMTEWGMGEVYLLGVLVALIKLSDLAAVNIGVGLLSMGGLIFVTTLMEWSMAYETLWRRLEGRGGKT